MLFKQTVNPPNCEARFDENMFKISTESRTNYNSKAAEHLGQEKLTFRPQRDFEVCLNGTTVLFIFSCSRWGPLLIPDWLSQFLGSLRLLLGDLLLRHDGHPWWYWPGDGLLGYVVVVDEGEEAPAAPRALRGVAAIHPSRHAAALLLQGEREQDESYQDETMGTQKVTWYREV